MTSCGSPWSIAQPVMPSPRSGRSLMISSAQRSRAITGMSSAPRLVGLVDREGVVRDDVRERVGDALEHRRVRLLRQDLVEDVGKPPIGVDEPVRARGATRRSDGRLDCPGNQAVHLSEFHAAAATSSSRLPTPGARTNSTLATTPLPSLERVIWLRSPFLLEVGRQRMPCSAGKRRVQRAPSLVLEVRPRRGERAGGRCQEPEDRQGCTAARCSSSAVRRAVSASYA